MSEGADLQGLMSDFLADLGETFTITRPPSTQGGASTTYAVQGYARPADPNEFPEYVSEATMNAGDSVPTELRVGGAEDVRVGDVFPHDGANYKIVNVLVRRVNGVTVQKRCMGQRTLS